MLDFTVIGQNVLLPKIRYRKSDVLAELELNGSLDFQELPPIYAQTELTSDVDYFDYLTGVLTGVKKTF